MTIAIISDIHGNSSALLAAFKLLDKVTPDKIFCLGDLVGYYPDTNMVIDLIRHRSIECVLGNHDLALVNNIDLGSPIANTCILMAKKTITNSNLTFLKSLLPEKRITINNNRLILMHGGPNDTLNQRIHPEHPIDTSKLWCNFLIVGHTRSLY